MEEELSKHSIFGLNTEFDWRTTYYPKLSLIQISVAKKQALLMSDYGYLPPCKEKKIKVLGKQALGMFMVGSDTMKAGKYISNHDQKIANKIAYVISGGDLSQATLVDEQYLLDLEREAFLSLC